MKVELLSWSRRVWACCKKSIGWMMIVEGEIGCLWWHADESTVISMSSFIHLNGLRCKSHPPSFWSRPPRPWCPCPALKFYVTDGSFAVQSRQSSDLLTAYHQRRHQGSGAIYLQCVRLEVSYLLYYMFMFPYV